MRGMYRVMAGLFLFPCLTQATEPMSVMPGKPVGLSSVQPVGTRLPQVGTRLPSVGSPLPGYGDRPTKPSGSDNPFQGNFPKVDPDLVVAPYPSESKTDDFWDDLMKRWAVAFGGQRPTLPQWTPGLARRNRERAKERERQEMLRRMRS